MKKKIFNIPIYEVKLTLLQVEKKDDFYSLKRALGKEGIPNDDIKKTQDIIENEMVNGGDTWYNLDKRIIAVVFYPFRNERDKVEIYCHEKRHVEDRILQYFRVDDAEGSALLSGYLGKIFYDFINS